MSDYIYYNNSFTNHDILETDFNTKEVLCVKEELYHDGYDSDGPKSDLYDLWILEKTYDDYILYFYHYENWFHPNDDKQYKLENVYKLSELSNISSCTYHKFFEFANLTKCKKIKLQLVLLH